MANEIKLSPREQKFIIFKLKCIMYDLSKFIVMSLFFYYIGHLTQYLFAVLVSIPLRTQSGGLHFKHYWSCFLFSFGYFTIIICVLGKILLPCSLFLLLMLFCSIINFCLSPIQSATRPLLSDVKRQAIKKKSYIITIYCAVVILIFYQTSFASVGYWTIILHSLQLLIAYILKKGGERCEKRH